MEEKDNYGGWTEIPSKFKKLIKGMNILSWPKPAQPGEPDWYYKSPGDNTTIYTFLGREVGLTKCRDNGYISVQLSHPMADFWLSIFKPIWAKQNEGKCLTCRGSGWDGIGYTYTCIDCGGTGKPKKNKETK